MSKKDSEKIFFSMLYPVKAFLVPKEMLDPLVPFNDYAPVNYTHPIVLENAKKSGPERWADPEDVSAEIPQARKTFYMMMDNRLNGIPISDSQIQLNSSGFPINPYRRTGYTGRGLLGKFGVNHAADPIVVRFNFTTLQLECVLIKRADTGQWAIPGGMVDEGENISNTLRREFEEEAASSINDNACIDRIFENSIPIFKGYSDDPRNTDDAWIETTCSMFFPMNNCDGLKLCHDNRETLRAQWVSFADLSLMDLFASHKFLLNRALHVAQNMLALNSEAYKNKFSLSLSQIMVTTRKREREHDLSYVS